MLTALSWCSSAAGVTVTYRHVHGRIARSSHGLSLDLGRAAGASWSRVEEPAPGWRSGDNILVELPDGQTVRCRVVNVKEDGTIQVVPQHAVGIH